MTIGCRSDCHGIFLAKFGTKGEKKKCAKVRKKKEECEKGEWSGRNRNGLERDWRERQERKKLANLSRYQRSMMDISREKSRTKSHHNRASQI